VIRITSSDYLVVRPLFPSNVIRKCPAVIFAVNRTASVPVE
jgi:hypothetical protein